MPNTFHEPHSASTAALRSAVTAGVLLLAGLVGYKLFLVRAHLDSVTVGLALAASVIVLVLSILANRNVARITRQMGVCYGVVCGLILGVLLAGTATSSVFLASNAVFLQTLIPISVGSTLVLALLAGLLSGWKTGSLKAGIRAGIWSSSIGLLIAYNVTFFLQIGFPSIVTQHDFACAHFRATFLASGVTDVRTFEILILLECIIFVGISLFIDGTAFGTIGALIGRLAFRSRK
jgi:hypothetical protein